MVATTIYARLRVMTEQIETTSNFYMRCGVLAPFKTDRMRSGRNSEVMRLSHPHGQWIVKSYMPRTSTQHDRLATEFHFLTYLAKNNATNLTCKPLGISRNLNQAVYSFLPGNRPSIVTSDHVQQAADFIDNINKNRSFSDAIALPMAADACLTWQDHLDLAESRINRLYELRPQSLLEEEMHTFVKEHLMPAWAKLKAHLLSNAKISRLDEPLPLDERIISPSDFGFHNTLENQGKLCFVDFEYAGWDDPAKLICDFICQPELPISNQQAWQFMHALEERLTEQQALAFRVELLLPLHRLKWCCILLNEFRAEDRLRRLHAGLDSDGLQQAQLSKAKKYFNDHCFTHR